MKKKIYLAVLAMCVALTVTACGDSEAKDSKTQTEAQEGTTASDAEKAADEGDAGEEAGEEEATGPVRLVTVDSVDKYVTIGEYKGLNLDNTVAEVTDDDVDLQVQTELEDKAEEVKSGTVEKGDIVTINYVGTKDGKTFEGGTANNYVLTVGDGTMVIDGFEDGLIGMKKGETKDLNLTYADDFQDEELAGQDVLYKVTLQSFKRVQELNDEWVAANTDYKTVDEYRAGVRTQLEDSAKASAEETLKSTAWNTVLGNSEVKEYPQEDIDNAVEELKYQTEVYAKQSDMELEDFVKSQGISMDDFEEQCQQYAQYMVKQNLIVQGILDAEGLTLEDEECKTIQDNLVSSYGVADLAGLVEIYGQESVDQTVGLIRVEDFIVENAVVQEKVSNGDTTGLSGDGNGAEAAAEDDVVDETEAAEDEEIIDDTVEAGDIVEDDTTADDTTADPNEDLAEAEN